MNSFQFREGSSELLPFCNNLWDSFIHNQTRNAGDVAEGIADYLKSMRDGDLLAKAAAGKLHIQLVDLGDINQPIGFCLTSLSPNGIGEIEALSVLEEYQGNRLGTKLMQTALLWLKANNVVEKRLKVVVGNEAIFSFYQKFQFYPVYTGLYGF
jgi:ribosomal protein S18 acetylase RimI-like enzyme